MTRMNRHFFTGTFLFGAAALVWVGAGFMGSNLLALAVTAVIAAVYTFGAWELRQFRRATLSLSEALAKIPEHMPSLGDWLNNLHPSLRNAVRLRIEGERAGLPGPALTPYLVGLLVMLGMLGTFLGMVVTLNGAVFALEGTTDLQAMRAALSAPVKGLGLAFGTSVAGVASSAMLGLMSAIGRRERMLAAQHLDTQIATSLRGFSLAHQRQETFRVMQSQAQALPAVVDQLQAMMLQMDRMSQQLNDRLLSNQDIFHTEVKAVYAELASSVDKSLRASLTQSAQVAAEGIKPLVQAALTGIAAEATHMHGRMIDAAQLQLDGLSKRFETTTNTVAHTWTAALSQHEQASASMVSGVGQTLVAFADTFEQRASALLADVSQAHARLQAGQASGDRQRLDAWVGSMQAMAATLKQEWQQAGEQAHAQQTLICSTLTQTAQDITHNARTNANSTLGEITRLMSSSEELIRSRITSEADWLQQNGQRMDQLATLLRVELGALREDEALRGKAAVERLGDLQTALTRHLTTLGTALEDPITRLIETASEAPRAAAEVIGQLRQQISSSASRDNELLEERSRILETLNTLLDSINHASLEQRAVIDSLVASSAVALQQTGNQFSDNVGLEAAKLADIAAHVTSSAVHVSSLSDAFGFAVNSFNEANEKLISSMERIEGALDKSMVRSDEQLGYYVAQAREIIHLSTLSQKEIFEELRQLAGKQTLLAEEVS
jgi:hypothetical protein